MKCKKCGYAWSYKGKLLRATCPNCGAMNKRSKSGVAPVLATLLMVAVAVAMSVIIFTWAQGFLSQTSSATGGQQGAQNVAAQSSVTIEDILATPSDTVPSFKIIVRNVGSVAVTIGQVAITGIATNAKFTGYMQGLVASGSLSASAIIGSDSSITYTTTGTTSSLSSIAKGGAVVIAVGVSAGTISTLKLSSGDVVTVKITTTAGTFAQSTLTVP